jgi:hypothetical protein
MPFSNDETILMAKQSNAQKTLLLLSIGLFVLSLFNICFCTSQGCRSSSEALLIGWLAMFACDAAVTWLANPFLFVAWVLMAKQKRLAWVFALLAAVLSSLFLTFEVVIENEAGQFNAITKIGLGYWLWLASCVATLVGSLLIKRKIAVPA